MGNPRGMAVAAWFCLVFLLAAGPAAAMSPVPRSQRHAAGPVSAGLPPSSTLAVLCEGPIVPSFDRAYEHTLADLARARAEGSPVSEYRAQWASDRVLYSLWLCPSKAVADAAAAQAFSGWLGAVVRLSFAPRPPGERSLLSAGLRARLQGIGSTRSQRELVRRILQTIPATVEVPTSAALAGFWSRRFPAHLMRELAHESWQGVAIYGWVPIAGALLCAEPAPVIEALVREPIADSWVMVQMRAAYWAGNARQIPRLRVYRKTILGRLQAARVPSRARGTRRGLIQAVEITPVRTIEYWLRSGDAPGVVLPSLRSDAGAADPQAVASGRRPQKTVHSSPQPE